VPTAFTKKEKKALFDAVKRANGEGVVFKEKAAKHAPGRPASGGSQLKYKFVATASCVVARQNGKRSVALELIDGVGKRFRIGNVTIPANHEMPAVGAVAEVRYLYAFPNGGSLYQPIFLGMRDDIEVSACTFHNSSIGQKRQATKTTRSSVTLLFELDPCVQKGCDQSDSIQDIPGFHVNGQ
jgi:bifunctional non-homologous end joining protein LigD